MIGARRGVVAEIEQRLRLARVLCVRKQQHFARIIGYGAILCIDQSLAERSGNARIVARELQRALKGLGGLLVVAHLHVRAREQKPAVEPARVLFEPTLQIGEEPPHLCMHLASVREACGRSGNWGLPKKP